MKINGISGSKMNEASMGWKTIESIAAIVNTAI